MKTDAQMLPSAALPQAEWEALSLLADGRTNSEQVRQALDLWARDAAAQERWQTWHLIGDVMRSADLAPAHAPGDVFLPQLRARLQGQAQAQAQTRSLPRTVAWGPGDPCAAGAVQAAERGAVLGFWGRPDRARGPQHARPVVAPPRPADRWRRRGRPGSGFGAGLDPPVGQRRFLIELESRGLQRRAVTGGAGCLGCSGTGLARCRWATHP